MRSTALIFTLLFLAVSAFAQTTIQQPEPAVITANTADVASPEAIIKAVYEVISGDAGKARNWDRFRTLFHKDARLIPTGKDQKGTFMARAMTPEDYISRNAPFFEKNGFHEREVFKKSERYGNIMHVFSTYEAFKTTADKEPFMRGINSFQLLFDGSRWWVLTIYWQAETPDNLLPKEYLSK